VLLDSKKKLDESARLPLSLDVVIPTYNRREMLERTLNSLVGATIPPLLEVRFLVVDNNSTDDTRAFILGHQQRFEGRLDYVFERRQGRSFALNAGIASGQGDLVAMIDDDEEVKADWYRCILSAFEDQQIDFIGGPYVPRWGMQPPDWLPGDYLGVIGWVDGGDEIVAYGEKFPGILMGGNAVLTRSILETVGPYNTTLSRSGKRLLAGEDEDMYRRLLDAGARGLYLPGLVIYHYIPPERLTKEYFRRWCFWRGVSQGILDREVRSRVAYLAGVPRWLYGRAARGAVRRIRLALGPGDSPDQSFAGELAVWDLVGFFYGKHFYRPPEEGFQRTLAT
jgi:glycosyltransferase involved in cell wall biosynthesis